MERKFHQADVEEIFPQCFPRPAKTWPIWSRASIGEILADPSLDLAPRIRAIYGALQTLPPQIAAGIIDDVETDSEEPDYTMSHIEGMLCTRPFPTQLVVQLIRAGLSPSFQVRIQGENVSPTHLETFIDFSRSLFSLADYSFLRPVLETYFTNFTRGEISPEDLPMIGSLLLHGIIPTEKLIRFLKDEGNGDTSYLIGLQQETAAGRLDPDNELQKELEYLSYLKLTGLPATLDSYQKFQSLHFIEPETNELTRAEQIEAEVAALEAAKLYWFVKERVDAGRKVAVIGNERYGWNFVVGPLQGKLENLGVRIGRHKVPSGTAGPEYIPVLPKLADFIASEKPDDIIIVDGTRNPSVGEKARFPRAMNGFINWFARNASGFHISHWLPYEATRIIIGDFVDTRTRLVVPATDKPQLILANPVHPQDSPLLPRQLRSHQPAYFDDLDIKVGYNIAKALTGKGVAVFTSHGIQILDHPDGDKIEEWLVAAVQQHMDLVLEEWIEKTTPKPHFD